MSLQLLRLQREITEAALRLAAGATADDLFILLAPALIELFDLRSVSLHTQAGYSREFGISSRTIKIAGKEFTFPIRVDRSELGEFRLVAGANVQTLSPDAEGTMRQICTLLRIAICREAAISSRQSEDWRALFDEHPAPLVVYELNSANIIAANAAFGEAYGYDLDELLGRRFTEVCVPDVEYLRLSDGHDRDQVAVRCRHTRRDGRRLDVEVSTRYCMWMNAPACIALINDVTSRTRIERRLVESEKRLERVQEMGGVGIFEFDPRTGQRYWSRELRRQFGVDEDAALPSDVGINVSSVHPDDRAAVLEAFNSSLHARKTCRIDHRIVQPSGKILWVQLQADMDYDQNGNAIRVIGTTVDITDRKAAEEQLGYLALFDPLTGLANRAQALSRLQDLVLSANRRNAYPALLFLDVDRFKAINDTLGHDVGDQVLIEVARRLKSATRQEDCVARMGGDEFVIVVSDGATTKSAEHISRRILALFDKPMLAGGREIFVTCSIGIAYCPSSGIEVDGLLTRADMAMYQAKRSGRKRFCVYQDEMLRETMARMDMEADLRRALENEEFFLVYQPIINVSQRRVTGIEALIRWRHPDGLRMPAQFIPIAEESELIELIGEWALIEACRQAVRWSEHADFVMSVNVSRRQLVNPHFVKRVFEILRGTGLDAARLQIEVTETALVSDIERTQQNLNALRKAGVRIAIDDFGTGYNSLANLRYSVIDALKIDRSFIRDIVESASDVAIAEAVITAGRSLGVRVVAEGVESEAHYQVLRRLGCDDAQGYWFSRPIEAGAFEELYVRASSRISA